MTPKDLEYRMPAEWEKHVGTLMEWPVRAEIWIDGLEKARMGYAEAANVISEFEELTMIVNPHLAHTLKSMCSSDIKVLEIEHDDSWIRDNGPTFLLNHNQKLAGVNWKFNSWGEKYHPWEKDDLVAEKVLEHFGIYKFDAPLILEGGSIHVDGEGTLITTEECLLNKNRNPEKSKEDIEQVLKNYLNVKKVIWFKRGLYGDETDGHIDNIACFVKPGVIAMQVCSDKNDPNYDITMENINTIKDEFDAKGRKLEIIKIEQPPIRHYNGARLTLSYINYYHVNGGIIVHTFGEDAKKADDNAVSILKEVFPHKKIAPVDGVSIIKGGGNVHCITQQIPYGDI
jgi:agmatine deiminase